MKPVSGRDPFAQPPSLMAEVEAAADEERRLVADMLRDLVERGLGERRWQARAEKEFQPAREPGVPDDAPPVTDAFRGKIAAGMEAARPGKLLDGDAVFAPSARRWTSVRMNAGEAISPHRQSRAR